MNQGHQLIRNTTAARLMNAVADGTSELTSVGIKTDNANGVLFEVIFDSITGTPIVKLEGSSDDSTWTSLNDNVATLAATDDNKIVRVEVYHPISRYLRIKITRGSSNSTIGGVIATLYGLRVVPKDSGSTISHELIMQDV